jgi:hypothetical protein
MLSCPSGALVRRFLAVLGLLFVVAGASVSITRPAHAEGGKQAVRSLITKGQDQFDEQMYEESIQTLSAALMRPGIAKGEKIEVYRLLAYNYITLQRDEEADAAVRGLLVLDPSFELPESESPRFRDLFKEVRSKWEEEGKPGLRSEEAPTRPTSVSIKHASPAQVEAATDISLTGTIDDGEAVVSQVKIYYRASGEEKYLSMRAGYAVRRFTATLPAEIVEPPLVEYYIEALDEAGLPVAGRGDAAAPLRIAVPDETSWYTSPWFWVPVSTVVVGSVIVIAAVLSTGGEEETTTSTVTIAVFE